jgi:hypothetical protein
MYIHDKTCSIFLPARGESILGGAAVQSLSTAGHNWGVEYSFAGAGTARGLLPVRTWQMQGQSGSYLRSLQVFYQVYDDNPLAELRLALVHATPTSGVELASLSLETGAGVYRASLELAAPAWWSSELAYRCEFVIDTPVAWEVLFHGIRLNLEIRR